MYHPSYGGGQRERAANEGGSQVSSRRIRLLPLFCPLDSLDKPNFSTRVTKWQVVSSTRTKPRHGTVPDILLP